MTEQAVEGVVVLAATPIGDIEDASPRLRTELRKADVIAAEDTRRLRRLLQRLDVETDARVVSYFEGNENARTPELLTLLQQGRRVVVVTDAGMPSVSDPGYRLVSAAVERNIRVTAVPGPSAVLVALAVSGLPVDRFCFEGFLPRKAGERSRRLAWLADEQRTMVFFEAPHRTAEALRAMADGFGADRGAAVCRELTKTYEEVRRGPLAELTRWAADGVRGEVTIVVAGAEALRAMADGFGADRGAAVCRELTKTYEEVRRGPLAELTRWAADGVRGEVTIVVAGAEAVLGDVEAGVRLVEQRMAGGMQLKPAVAEVSARLGLAKNALYTAVLDAR